MNQTQAEKNTAFNQSVGDGQFVCRGCGRVLTAVAEGEPCYNCSTPHTPPPKINPR